MKNRFAVTMLVVIFASITSFASPRELENRVSEYSERLELTDEQIDEIKPLLEETVKERETVSQQMKGAVKRKDQRRFSKELERIAERTDRELERILTDEQADEWTRIRSEVEEKQV